MTTLSKPELACIVLAAGSSKRFGGAKLLHKLPSGLTVIQQTVTQYLKVFSEVTMVVREADAALQDHLSLSGVNFVVSANANQGLSHSLIAGVKELQTASAWMIALGDMPYLKVSTIASLADASTSGCIVQPIHLDKPGNPVVFGRDFYSELTALDGDKGGRELVEKNQDHLVRLKVSDPGIHLDIDRPEDVML